METVAVHTSDLLAYRRCRRKWDWTSYMRRNLEPLTTPHQLWFGTVCHKAMELYHSKAYPGVPLSQLFIRALEETDISMRPPEWQELRQVGVAILDYYENRWSRVYGRNRFVTVTKAGKPLVEVDFSIPLGVFIGPTNRPVQVFYEGRIDRIFMDPDNGLYWVEDYKFVKRFNVHKLDMDFQMTAYTWAAQSLFGRRFEGVCYMQFLKEVPKGLRVLSSGEFSAAQNQGKISGLIMQEQLQERYGPARNWPKPLVDILQQVQMRESPDYDEFIRRDWVYRSPIQLANFEKAVRAQVREMLSPGLPLYPNPTADCSWDCSFKGACLAMEDGYDYEQILAEGFRTRPPRGGDQDS